MKKKRCFPFFHKWTQWQINTATLSANVGDKVPVGVEFDVTLEKKQCIKCDIWKSDINVEVKNV